jgi:inner membrane protein|tara:strand:- start:699 stop:1157 length:459 start_codon:yes stop_codon:yes gene_type:complete
MYYTHLAFGLLVSLLSIEFFPIKNKILFIIIATFFSILPDIDESRSKIGRKNKIISKTINFIFGHRGFIHTIYIPIIIFILFNLINTDIAYAALIGYLSHLLGDSLTKAGITPLYPLINKRINGFLKTNSFFEKIIFLALILANLYLIIKYI